MLMTTIDIDRPDRSPFLWEGGIEGTRLQTWAERHGWNLPRDLLNFWQETGGGQMFGSERFLRPFGGERDADGVVTVNAVLRDLGMPAGYLAFHLRRGGISAVRLADARYVLLDSALFHEVGVYPSLVEWYCRVIRPRYGKELDAPGR